VLVLASGRRLSNGDEVGGLVHDAARLEFLDDAGRVVATYPR
jgi:hypothetical protein